MYDLIVIGGGPAGSGAGRQAGKMGLETLLVEKEVFPRYKACGGAFSEHAISYLDFAIPQYIQEKIYLALGCILEAALWKNIKNIEYQLWYREAPWIISYYKRLKKPVLK